MGERWPRIIIVSSRKLTGGESVVGDLGERITQEHLYMHGHVADNDTSMIYHRHTLACSTCFLVSGRSQCSPQGWSLYALCWRKVN